MPKYVDIPSIIQVIGCIYNNPSLLDQEDKYHFCEEDFTEEFHQIIFGSIYNLHMLGAKEINVNAIEDYLAQRPDKFAVYKLNKGADYLQKVSQMTQQSTFDYYYNRMKKMTLLRMYQKAGMDLTWLYDPDNIMDSKKKQAQEDWLDNTSINDIANAIDKKIADVRLKYADDANTDVVNAGNGASDLLERLREVPEIGYPLYGPLINTVCRGARLKKFYLRSSATGIGKSRSMIADACFIACDELYNSETQKWEPNGTKEPTMFITTEQEIEEIQTMMIAFLSDVNEEHIINGDYLVGEWDRVIYAAELLKKCPIYVQELPDFSLQDIENAIKYGIREYGTKYIFLDYIHSSMKILSEISAKSGVRGLREDNVLFMISIRLKDLCNEYGVFIMSATQLNSEYRTADRYDQNLLRGAKSIGDKIDLGMIMLEVSTDDLTALEPVLQQGGFPQPQIKISIYKNRRGRYKDILLWATADRGTCKITPMFATDYTYGLIQMDDLNINVQPSAF